MTKDAGELIKYLPRVHREGIERIAMAGGVTVEAAFALSLASEAIRDYCPETERGKVAGLLLVTYTRGKP